MNTPSHTLRNPVFCAVDTADVGQATALAAKVADTVGGLKLGLEFFSANGPKGVQQVQKASDLPIFLDLKFHDIPNTVAGAVRSAAAPTSARAAQTSLAAPLPEPSEHGLLAKMGANCGESSICDDDRCGRSIG